MSSSKPFSPQERIKTDFHVVWNIREGDFEPYDNIWNVKDPRLSRSAFVNHSTGPYTEIEFANSLYKSYISFLIDEDFSYVTQEEKDAGYEVPRVEILGCHLPEGKMIPMCGRTPFERGRGDYL